MGGTEDLQTCLSEPHPLALKGIDLFNQGEYWHAHEALEEAWLEEAGEVRNLYRGILQAGVVYLHVTRCNYRGAVKVYHRSRRWLEPFPSRCQGIDIELLRADLEVVFTEICRLGPDALQHFDLSLLRPIRFVPPG